MGGGSLFGLSLRGASRLVVDRRRDASSPPRRGLPGLVSLAAALLVLASPALAQPTLEQAVQIEVADYTPTTHTVVEQRIATSQEVQDATLGDPDGDGVKSIADACPVNPFCSSREQLVDEDGDGFPAWHDGNDQDLLTTSTGNPVLDQWPLTDDFTVHIAAFPSQEAIVEAALEENEVKALYPQADILSVAEQAGFDPDQVEVWQEEFGESTPACDTCRDPHLTKCLPRCERRKTDTHRVRCELRCYRQTRRRCSDVCTP